MVDFIGHEFFDKYDIDFKYFFLLQKYFVYILDALSAWTNKGKFYIFNCFVLFLWL